MFQKGLKITEYLKNNDSSSQHTFQSSYTTKSKKHGLPFDITINDPRSLLKNNQSFTKLIHFYPFDQIVQWYISEVSKEQYDSRTKNRNRSYYTGSVKY